ELAEELLEESAVPGHDIAYESALLFGCVRPDRVRAIPMIFCARRRSCCRDRFVVAPVDQLHARAVTGDRVDAAHRAVGGKEHDAPAAEGFGECGDGAP